MFDFICPHCNHTLKIDDYTGQDIRELRLSKKLTQAEFGSATGLDTAVVSRIENGLKISAATALKLSAFYRLPLKRFYQHRIFSDGGNPQGIVVSSNGGAARGQERDHGMGRHNTE